MASWSEFEVEAPDLAREVHAAFTVRRHATMATLRKDGAPRISGTEVEFAGGELLIGSMPGALKARDLARDPRIALHSPTVDPPEDRPTAWPGEAKLAGRAVELPRADDGSHRFRIDITEAVMTRVGVPTDHLVITSWHEGRGIQGRRRY